MAVVLASVVTHDLAAQVAAQCQRALAAEQSKVWLLNASALDQFDSSALAVLLSLRRSAQAAGAELQVQGAPQRLQQLAGLYGVAGLLQLSPNTAH